MPTQAEIEQHQQDVEELSALAVAAVAATVMAADGDDAESTLLRTVPATLTPYMSAAAGLAVDWYRGLARLRPRTPEPKPGAPPPIVGPTDRISLLDAQDFEPQPAELPPTEQIESTVRWALYEPPEPAPVDTSQMEPDGMSEDELRREVQRLRPDTPEVEQLPDVPEPTAEARPQQGVTARVTTTVSQAPQPRTTRAEEAEPEQRTRAAEESPRARVVGAEESGPRARIIPADATEQQARTISRLAGATQRYVTTAARDTLTTNANAENVRWARHAQPDACAFCRMLATRGPDYLTKESASVVGTTGRNRGSRMAGELYHDVCECEPVPVRAGDVYEPPDYVGDWTAQYDDAVAEVGNAYDTKAILASMRAAEKANGGSTH